MKITRDDVHRVAELANLELTEAEIATYGEQLGSILSYCEKLNELDTQNVEPLAQVVEAAGSNSAPGKQAAGHDPIAAQHLREDKSRDAAVIRQVVSRAPEGLDA